MNDADHNESKVPPMPNLDALTRAEQLLDGTLAQQSSPTEELPTFSMPSSEATRPAIPQASHIQYHDLGKMYPMPPIPSFDGGLVLHNATVNDHTGCDVVLNWLSEGHGSIVDMKRLMKRNDEFILTVKILQSFIEDDLQGQIIKLTDSRLMILPPGCRGVRGTEMEGFAVEANEFEGSRDEYSIY